MMFRARARDLVALAVGLVIANLLLEGGFRIYLARTVQAERARVLAAAEAPSFSAHAHGADGPLWVLNREYGWDYNPRGYRTASVRLGKFDGCGENRKFTRYGNIGSATADFAGADLKIAFLGSSYTMGTPESGAEFFHEIFARRLAQLSGRKVAVENFSRDSYSVLQMFDQAAAVAAKYAPDVVVIAFNSWDMVRPRTWRHVLPAGKGFYRFYQATTPDPGELGPATALVHETVISAAITDEWCARMTKARDAGDPAVADDPLLKALVAAYHHRRFESAASVRNADFTTLKYSFAYHALVYRSPYRGLLPKGKTSILEAVDWRDFAVDRRLVAAIEKLKSSPARIFLVHIPAYPELKEGVPFETAGQFPRERLQALAASLERLTGGRILSLMSHIENARANAETLVEKHDEPGQNWHPSRRIGTEAYAAAAARAVFEALEARERAGARLSAFGAPLP
jgi:hypothetical protein